MQLFKRTATGLYPYHSTWFSKLWHGLLGVGTPNSANLSSPSSWFGAVCPKYITTYICNIGPRPRSTHCSEDSDRPKLSEGGLKMHLVSMDSATVLKGLFQRQVRCVFHWLQITSKESTCLQPPWRTQRSIAACRNPCCVVSRHPMLFQYCCETCTKVPDA